MEAVARATQERKRDNGAAPRWNDANDSGPLMFPSSDFAEVVVVYSRGSIVSPYCFRYSWFRDRDCGLEDVGMNHFSMAGIPAKHPRGKRKGFEGSKAWVRKVERLLSGRIGRSRHGECFVVCVLMTWMT